MFRQTARELRMNKPSRLRRRHGVPPSTSRGFDAAWTTETMQHEVLLALVGCTGDFIVDDGSCFRLVHDVPFLSDSHKVGLCAASDTHHHTA